MKRWILERWKLIAVVFAVVLAAGGWWFMRARRQRDELPEVATAQVRRGDLQVTVAATGILEPLTTVEVKSRTGGEIAEMQVEAGDYVEAGDLIAQLDPADLQDRVDEATAQVDAAKARVQQAQYSARAQSEQTQTQIKEAQAGLATARARLKQAEAEYDEALASTRQDIRQAEARLSSAKARLEQARAQEEAEPETVNAQIQQADASLAQAKQQLAALEAGNRPEEVAQARARVTEAEAVADNAEAELGRSERLYEKGYVSGQDLDATRRTYRTAQAQLDSARQAYELSKKGPRQEDIEQARAQVRQAQASLKAAQMQRTQIDVSKRETEAAQASVAEAEAGLAAARSNRTTQIEVRRNDVEAARQAVDQAKAALQRARAGTLTDAAQRQSTEAAAADRRRAQANLDDVRYNFEHTTVTAPRAGVVLEKLAEEGTVIPAGTAALAQGTAIVTLADISEMYVMADVDEVDISRVEIGQFVSIEVETLPDARIRGEVQKIFPEGKEKENVIYFPVRIKVIDLLPELRPGMTVDVDILTAERKDVLLVPDSAIDRSGGKTRVLVLPEPGAEPVERDVEVGITDWEQTEIKSGLKEGQTVVLPSAAPEAVMPERGKGDRGRAARRATRVIGRRRR